MSGIIRRVFGTTRPKEIYGDLLTFDRLVAKPIAHIIYWLGLGLLVIAAFGVLGISVGNAIKDPTPTGILLSLPFLIIGWLGILIGVFLWRGFCEFYLAVMSIAEDLRILRQYQEKLDGSMAPASRPAEPAAPPVYSQVAEEAPPPAPLPESTERPHDVMEDPFFNPRFGKRDY